MFSWDELYHCGITLFYCRLHHVKNSICFVSEKSWSPALTAWHEHGPRYPLTVDCSNQAFEKKNNKKKHRNNKIFVPSPLSEIQHFTQSVCVYASFLTFSRRLFIRWKDGAAASWAVERRTGRSQRRFVSTFCNLRQIVMLFSLKASFQIPLTSQQACTVSNRFPQGIKFCSNHSHD